MSDDPIKAEKDLSTLLDEQFPVIEKLDTTTAIDRYLALEKQTRQAADAASSKRVLIRIVDTLANAKQWDLLNDLVVSLSKKHGQLKLSIQQFIQTVINHLDDLDESNKSELNTKIKLIETIRTVADKKIFVEVERAVVSKKLAEIQLEHFNDLDRAVDILCDLQVETYSLMPFADKVQYILDQVKLTLQKGDFAQAKVLSRKILIKTLKNHPHYKAVYLRYLIAIGVHENDYLSIVTNTLQLIELDEVKNNKQELGELLVSAIYYVVLAPHEPRQHDLMHRIKDSAIFRKNVDSQILALLDIFTTNELIHWLNIEELYRAHLQSSEIFRSTTNYTALQHRIIEHNLRVVNQYYQFIRLERLQYLLQLGADETEQHVCELVNKGMINAKVNRPQGIVKFDRVKEEPKDKTESVGDSHVNELLSEWCYDVDRLLEEVDSIGHLINKEEMMYGMRQAV